MNEKDSTPEIARDIRVDDAEQLATLLYYTLDREMKASDPADMEVSEVRQQIQGYLEFRAKQDPEIGRMLVGALESFQDPSPDLALPEAASEMRDTAASIRRNLELPHTDGE